MSSGEVLFILAFIVLPTAILVSSAWAVLFVRRHPDRVVERSDIEMASEETYIRDRYDVVLDTAVLPTIDRATAKSPSDVDDTEGTETSIQDDSFDEMTQTENDLDIPPALPESNRADATDDVSVVLEESEAEMASDSVAQEESDYLQATDDLNQVVAEVVATDSRSNQIPSPPDDGDDAESDSTTYETTDLPVLERRPEETPERQLEPEPISESDPDDSPEAHEPEESPQSRWKRRKRPAPLRPNDPDAGRARGGGRDPQRRVPQIGRATRKRDGDPDNDDTT